MVVMDRFLGGQRSVLHAIMMWMSNRFPAITLLITAGTYAGFAIWLSIRPDALLDAFGIETSTPQMLTEIRAFYGGIEMAIAVVMVVLWRRGDHFAALLTGALPLAASAAGRCLGMMVDGYSPLHAGFALMEAIGSVCCLAGCWIVSGTRGG